MLEILHSILVSGKDSPFVNRFYEICCNMSIAHLRMQKNISSSKYLTQNLGCTFEELASDCIADLFEEKDRYFIHFNTYFEKICKTKKIKHDEEVKAYLKEIIRKRTNQYTANLRENLGDMYWKTRKAVRIYLQRNQDKYQKISHHNENYILLVENNENDFDSEQFPPEELLFEIFMKKYNHFFVSEVVENIFIILSNQCKFCKAIKEDYLFSIVKKAYERRLSDNIKYNYPERELN
ncbi:MAG: hypothetical protein EHM58_05245 [Ignavibacteriae bacterium]|nr:MAG: hypothetical protein EHM58_05245 [Ignavibacteriota bacterium]